MEAMSRVGRIGLGGLPSTLDKIINLFGPRILPWERMYTWRLFLVLLLIIAHEVCPGLLLPVLGEEMETQGD